MYSDPSSWIDGEVLVGNADAVSNCNIICFFWETKENYILALCRITLKDKI